MDDLFNVVLNVGGRLPGGGAGEFLGFRAGLGAGIKIFLMKFVSEFDGASK